MKTPKGAARRAASRLSPSSESGRSAKVFIGWSGPRSKAIATALKKWLPNVLQNLDPWMSELDIDAGARWSTEVGRQLNHSNCGVMCITSDNVTEPWINFEAGALSKIVTESRVCTYLHGLKPTDISGPLTEFQAKATDKDGTRAVLETLNKSLDDLALEAGALDKAFDKWWSDLEGELSKIPLIPALRNRPPQRSDRELLEEILGRVRDLERSEAPSRQLARDIVAKALQDAATRNLGMGGGVPGVAGLMTMDLSGTVGDADRPSGSPPSASTIEKGSRRRRR